MPLGELKPADSPRTGGEDADHIRVLAELDGPLPPIVVHRSTMRVVDGMHRVRAAALRGEKSIRVTFFEGNPDEAFVWAVKSNSAHGLPLSNVDRSAAAVRILDAHPNWSNVAIASVVGLSDKTIAALRERSTAAVPKRDSRVGHDGRARPVDPVAGRLRAGKLIAEKPGASLREIAAEAGIAVNTARDVRERMRRGQGPLPRRFRQDEGHSPGTGTRARAGTGEKVSTEDLMTILRKDPSLRLTDAGRAMLRLLDAHAIDDDNWDRLVASVPDHCAQAIVDLARRCVSSWDRFADRLEARDRQ